MLNPFYTCFEIIIITSHSLGINLIRGFHHLNESLFLKRLLNVSDILSQRGETQYRNPLEVMVIQLSLITINKTIFNTGQRPFYQTLDTTQKTTRWLILQEIAFTCHLNTQIRTTRGPTQPWPHMNIIAKRGIKKRKPST